MGSGVTSTLGVFSCLFFPVFFPEFFSFSFLFIFLFFSCDDGSAHAALAVVLRTRGRPAGGQQHENVLCLLGMAASMHHNPENFYFVGFLCVF